MIDFYSQESSCRTGDTAKPRPTSLPISTRDLLAARCTLTMSETSCMLGSRCCPFSLSHLQKPGQPAYQSQLEFSFFLLHADDEAISEISILRESSEPHRRRGNTQATEPFLLF
jgi:hypothetical protein